MSAAETRVLLIDDRVAWRRYRTHSVYLAPLDAPEFEADSIGFVIDGAIQQDVPAILAMIDLEAWDLDVATELRDSGDAWAVTLGAVVERFVTDGIRTPESDGERVVLLSPPADPRGDRLPAPVPIAMAPAGPGEGPVVVSLLALQVASLVSAGKPA